MSGRCEYVVPALALLRDGVHVRGWCARRPPIRTTPAMRPTQKATDTHTRTSSKCKLLLSTTIEEVTRFAIVDNDDDDVCVLEGRRIRNIHRKCVNSKCDTFRKVRAVVVLPQPLAEVNVIYLLPNCK